MEFYAHKLYRMECQRLLSVILIIVLQATHGFFVDYTENTELIQQTVGYDIKLPCNLKGLVDESKLSEIKVHWFFKQCENENLGYTNNCYNDHMDDWTQLPCEENFCKPDLLLRNVTEKYSGLYKCTVIPHLSNTGHSLDIQLVRTYQLEVKNNSIAVPDFLDSFPLNKTVPVGSQAVFQCRVHSVVHPTIKWFRRKLESGETKEYNNENEAFNAHIVRYNGITYELLPTAREKIVGDDIYLSKLILNGVGLQNEGFYACVAISYRGHRVREAYLEVYTMAEDDVDYWVDYDTTDEEFPDRRKFWMLFLMPLGLAMLPISVWFIYLIHKRCQDVRHVQKTDQYSDEDLAGDHCILRS